MQRHQLYAIGVWARLRLARLQCRVGKKCLQRRQLTMQVRVKTKIPRRCHQLFQVFDAADAFLTTLFLVIRGQGAALHGQFHGFPQTAAGDAFTQTMNEPQESIQGPQGARRQRLVTHRCQRCLPQGHLIVARHGAQMVHAALADPPRRRVDHPFEGGIVIAQHRQPQICQRILDLGALVETHAAVDPVGDAGLQERLFQQP